MNRSESKYFHTAERMDEALLSLLTERDFECVTVKDICARAGVNRSTFYLHYENTADLLEEAVALLHARYQKKHPASWSNGAEITAWPKRELFFITEQWLLPWLEFIKENRRVYKAIHAQENVFGVERTYRAMFQDVFSPILLRYGVRGERQEYMMEFYRRGLAAVTLKWAASGCRESVAEIVEIIKLCVGYTGDEKEE